MQREATRMTMGQAQQGSIMSGIAPGGAARRGSASKDDIPRSGSSKHVRNK